MTRRRGSVHLWLLLVLTIVAVAAVSYLSVELHRKVEAERDRAVAANEALTLRLKALEEEREAATRRAEESAAQAASLAATKDSLEADLASKEAQLHQLQATYEELDRKMRVEIASGDIRLTQAGGRIQVELIDKVLFDSGEAKLSSRGEEVLARVGATLANIADKQIQVSGHTDDSPISERLVTTYASNWELSTARAVNVVRFLSESAKVPAARLIAAGHGQHRPVASNASATGRARNRRIELILLPELAPQKVARVAAGEAPKKVSAAKVKKPR